MNNILAFIIALFAGNIYTIYCAEVPAEPQHFNDVFKQKDIAYAKSLLITWQENATTAEAKALLQQLVDEGPAYDWHLFDPVAQRFADTIERQDKIANAFIKSGVLKQVYEQKLFTEALQTTADIIACEVKRELPALFLQQVHITPPDLTLGKLFAKVRCILQTYYTIQIRR